MCRQRKNEGPDSDIAFEHLTKVMYRRIAESESIAFAGGQGFSCGCGSERGNVRFRWISLRQWSTGEAFELDVVVG